MNVIKYQLPRFLARGLQFSWQNGEELANWTGTFNFTDDGAVKSGSDTGTRYQHQREWLQRSRALHMNHKCGHRLYEQTGLQFALAVRYCSPRHIRCWGCPSAVLFSPFKVPGIHGVCWRVICVLASPIFIPPPRPRVTIWQRGRVGLGWAVGNAPAC